MRWRRSIACWMRVRATLATRRTARGAWWRPRSYRMRRISRCSPVRTHTFPRLQVLVSCLVAWLCLSSTVACAECTAGFETLLQAFRVYAQALIGVRMCRYKLTHCLRTVNLSACSDCCFFFVGDRPHELGGGQRHGPDSEGKRERVCHEAQQEVLVNHRETCTRLAQLETFAYFMFALT